MGSSIGVFGVLNVSPGAATAGKAGNTMARQRYSVRHLSTLIFKVFDLIRHLLLFEKLSLELLQELLLLWLNLSVHLLYINNVTVP
jgi:hypothetical protein